MRDRTEYSSESNLQQRNNSLSLPPWGHVLTCLVFFFSYEEQKREKERKKERERKREEGECRRAS